VGNFGWLALLRHEFGLTRHRLRLPLVCPEALLSWPALKTSEDEEMMASFQDMPIAVLGCGSIGSRHLGNLLQLGCRRLIAYDPNPAALASLGKHWITICSVLEQVWEQQPAAVLITAPSNLHLDLAAAAVAHQCHVFIEKPLLHRLEGLEGLLADIKLRQLRAMVACNMRFHPGPAAIKQLLDEGIIGTVLSARIQTGSYLPRWRPAQDYRRSYSASLEWGGAVLDCIHELDLDLWYFGPASLVAAKIMPARNIGLATDGLAEILLQHESGAVSSVHLNFVQRDYRRTCQVIGSQGTIYWDHEEGVVKVFGPDGQIARTLPAPAGWTINQMYIDELKHFFTAIVSGAPLVNSLNAAIATLRLALQIRSTGCH
jgi:predicted dehydrogenase